MIELSFADRKNASLILGKLTYDEAWTDIIQRRIDEEFDIRVILAHLARTLKPERYLEIGVRRGHSMAMVAGLCPDCAIYGFDAWITDYGGVPNPGPEFVKSEMVKVGHTGPLHLYSGDTADTLRKMLAFLSEEFQLILIDGDHSHDGMLYDVVSCTLYLAPGGYIIIDDLPDGWLDRVWGHLGPYQTYQENTVGIIRRSAPE